MPGFIVFGRHDEERSLTWDALHLDVYLKAPQKKVPGTKMGFPGFDDPKDEADTIAYLETLSSSGWIGHWEPAVDTAGTAPSVFSYPVSANPLFGRTRESARPDGHCITGCPCAVTGDAAARLHFGSPGRL